MRRRHYQVTLSAPISERFVVRAASKREIGDLYRIYEGNSVGFENALCKLCTESPSGYDWDYCFAGVQDRLADVILDLSGMKEDGMAAKYASEATSWLTSTRGKLELIAMITLPWLDLETLEDADPPDYFRYIQMGQAALMTLYGIDPKTILEAGAAKDGSDLPVDYSPVTNTLSFKSTSS